MRALLIHNPIAGWRAQREQLPACIRLLEDAGWIVQPTHTQGPGHAGRLAFQAPADGFDLVLVAGGDGTINQVANGLMAARRAHLQAVGLGILPAGTANVLARDLGLPAPGPGRTRTLVEATELLLQSSLEQIDIGRATGSAGERHFICWAGIGLDAAITAHVEANPQAKQRFGPLFFAVSALLKLGQLRRPAYFRIEADDQVWTGPGVLLVASNIQHYAIVLDVAPHAALNDGLVDLAFFRASGLLNMIKQLWLLRTGQHVNQPDVSYMRARRIAILADSEQPVHVDAEPFGLTPLEITVVPRALPMLIPRAAIARGLIRTS